MKVLAVSSYGRLGGAELALGTFLTNRPPEVEAAALVIGTGELPQMLGAIGIPCWQAESCEGRPTAAQFATFARALDRLLDQQRPDVVWAVGLKAAIMSAASCRRSGVPIVWQKVDFTLDRYLTRPVAAVVDGVIAVSRAAAGQLDNPMLRAKLLGVVGPPVALGEEVFSHPDPSCPIVGSLGTLMPIKGHHHLIAAAALLVPEFPALRIEIGGGETPAFPSYRSELTELAGRLGIDQRVHLPGVTDPGPLLERLTVYVSATFRMRGYGYEGLSGAMLEASWTGIPVVATRGGGTPDGVIDGVTGTLVEPADPRAMARAIGSYLRDPERARKAGEAGRAFAREHFAPQPAAKALFGHLAEVIR